MSRTLNIGRGVACGQISPIEARTATMELLIKARLKVKTAGEAALRHAKRGAYQ